MRQERPRQGEGDGGGEGPASALAAELLAIAPHVLVAAGGILWVDARGLSVRRVARSVLAAAVRQGGGDGGGVAPRVGAARTAIAAEVAATAERAAAAAESPPIRLIRAGWDRRFLAPLPVSVIPQLRALPRLAAAFSDVGLRTCGDLARLTREAVEVRFGAEGVALWRLARADDPRRLFSPVPRALPAASLEWEDYVLRDAERLVFVANRLVTAVCTELHAWGESARSMVLGLRLASRATLERPVRGARASASRAGWLRLVRAELARLTLEEGVTGLSLRVEAAGEAEAPQGDLFDRGFQTRDAAEAALAQLVDDRCATIAGLAPSGHPLPERRTRWRGRQVAEALGGPGYPGVSAGGSSASRTGAASGEREGGGQPSPAARASLALQLCPVPRPVAVVSALRRGARVPVRYRERADDRRASGTRAAAVPMMREVEILTALGPDRLSGGDDAGEGYTRDYFHCLTTEGQLVLLFHDRRSSAWFLHGWWD